MENIPTLSTIHQYFKDTDLLKEVVQQIQKDFEWYNINIQFSGNSKTPYEELFEQIFPYIDKMIVEEYEKLRNIMYRIDIDEGMINRYLRQNPMADTSEVIVDLILKRELQKVVIRNLYKKKFNT
jgi:cell division protein FtsI/penicillin-binding protein 2